MDRKLQLGKSIGVLHTAWLAVVIILIFSLNGIGQVAPVVYAEGFSNPVAIAHTGGDARLFVVERGGSIRIIHGDGTTDPTPFLDISGLITAGGERGLLGLAFHPDYAENGYFFVNYTDLDGNTVIARFTVSDSDPDVADAGTPKLILSIDQPYSNHNGGDLKFGPDGYLYIGTGDGGSSGDPDNNAQDLSSLLGKMLRIDIDNGTPYSIPSGNPYIENAEAADEIWASGLRNPWRFSFDRETGDMWIADVGQNSIEEVNFIPVDSSAGMNFGWRCYEGEETYNASDCVAESEYWFPQYQYYHSTDNGCSVTGGFVYRGVEFPSLDGYYFFTDYCNDILYSLHDSSGQWVLTKHGQYSGNNFSTFGEDWNGEIYVAGISSGTVYKLTAEEGQTGIDNHGLSPWTIYPNPANDQIFVRSEEHNMQPEKIRILSMSGELVREYTPGSSGGENEISGIPPGMFLVEIVDSGRIQYEKLIILQH
jgi:glucose/arabinose dehydrogenase